MIKAVAVIIAYINVIVIMILRFILACTVKGVNPAVYHLGIVYSAELIL